MMASIGTTVFASDSHNSLAHSETDKVQINDVITTDKETGEKGIVISVEKDGSFVTAPFDISRGNPATCGHSAVVEYGNSWIVTESLNGTSSSRCYAKRTVCNAKCGLCGMSGFQTYSDWTYVSHSFPWFSKTCDKCGYVK